MSIFRATARASVPLPMARASAPLLLAAFGACASGPAPQALPPELALRPGESWLGTVSARGAQVYECRVSPAGAGWAFVAPDAELFDEDGRPAGHHGAGPSWQAPDGSRVEAKATARADAPATGAIPWLLLEARSTGPTGRFDRVTSIRRVNTAGGSAPRAGCGEDNAGRQARVLYTADYLLYTVR